MNGAQIRVSITEVTPFTISGIIHALTKKQDLARAASDAIILRLRRRYMQSVDAHGNKFPDTEAAKKRIRRGGIPWYDTGALYESIKAAPGGVASIKIKADAKSKAGFDYASYVQDKTNFMSYNRDDVIQARDVVRRILERSKR